MIHKYFSISLLFLSFITFSQLEDESCLPPNKKVLKLIETATKSSDPKVVAENLSKAIDAAPDNAMAYYEYAMFAYKQGVKSYETQSSPTMGDRSFAKSREMFLSTIEVCSDYHANCYYYLGVIAYSQRKMDEAIQNFKSFVAFKSSNAERYDADHDKKLKDVKEILDQLEGERDLKANKVPFEPKMIANVSSPNDEYFPMISPDNELMFYTRKLDRKNLGDELHSNWVEEFTFSQRSSMTGPFDNGTPFKKPFNDGTFQSYGAATMSVDNKEMIMCACKDEMINGQKYRNCDLYSTRFERTGAGGNDFVWTELVNLGPGINSKDGWEGQPSLSADGNTLFYTAYRNTTKDNDIFIATRDSKGKWSEGRPFDEINTPGKDKSPFLHQDSETLYFVSTSSDTRKGIGGLDIFYTRMENGKWSKPKNIGYPINTEEDELGIFVALDGKLAYFSSKQKADWNIYGFELYPEARPKPVAMVKGELKDNNGQPVEGATIEIAYANSDKVEQVKVNGNDGKYAAIIKTEVAQDVMVTVKKEGHAFDSKLITKEELQGEKVLRGSDLAVRELKAGEAYTINDILYATNSSELNSKSQFILKQFARFLSENPTITIMIQGHTDDIGDDNQNMKLSEQRAEEVKKYLVKLGISESRLTSKGFGETKPKVPNSSNENRAINRRTDFLIQKL
jgi:outer membrane protein OmpA-like peptidoglycan-associated protein/tetratricopeptide (TPR) repeat protein